MDIYHILLEQKRNDYGMVSSFFCLCTPKILGPQLMFLFSCLDFAYHLCGSVPVLKLLPLYSLSTHLNFLALWPLFDHWMPRIAVKASLIFFLIAIQLIPCSFRKHILFVLGVFFSLFPDVFVFSVIISAPSSVTVLFGCFFCRFPQLNLCMYELVVVLGQ